MNQHRRVRSSRCVYALTDHLVHSATHPRLVEKHNMLKSSSSGPQRTPWSRGSTVTRHHAWANRALVGEKPLACKWLRTSVSSSEHRLPRTCPFRQRIEAGNDRGLPIRRPTFSGAASAGPTLAESSLREPGARRTRHSKEESKATSYRRALGLSGPTLTWSDSVARTRGECAQGTILHQSPYDVGRGTQAV